LTRIVSGRWGGRRLVTPKGDTTRPTSERVRAAVGNALEAAGLLGGARVLDLFAGSGALALELLSRGAAEADLVESDRAALTALRGNVAALAAPARVVAADVRSFVAGPHPAPWQIVVADPPYELDNTVLAGILDTLIAAGGLAPGGEVVLERAVRSGGFDWPEPLAGGRAKRYGDTEVLRARLP
jgi:16S rRNA (guanine966-N2)-methyltransferase